MRQVGVGTWDEMKIVFFLQFDWRWLVRGKARAIVVHRLHLFPAQWLPTAAAKCLWGEWPSPTPKIDVLQRQCTVLPC